MQNVSHENKLDLHDNRHAGETCFHMNVSHEDSFLFDTNAKGNLEVVYYNNLLSMYKYRY